MNEYLYASVAWLIHELNDKRLSSFFGLFKEDDAKEFWAHEKNHSMNPPR